MKPHPRRRGFTLVELLVVILVIGILIALIFPAINHSTDRYGRRTQCLNNIRNISAAMEGYINEKGRFPNAGTFGDDANGTYTRAIDHAALTVALAGTDANPGEHDLGPLHSWVVNIAPYLDYQHLYNDFDRNRVYFSDERHPLFNKSETNTDTISNREVSELDMQILRCPNDDTTLPDRGNLSYAVNMGFARWAGLPSAADANVVAGSGWQGSEICGKPNTFTWGLGGYALHKKTSLFFLGTKSGKAPWDMHHTVGSIRDGSSHTVMISENVRGGATDGGAPYGWTYQGKPVPTNWATPHPNFIGFVTSERVCGEGAQINCATATDLSPTAKGETGLGWTRANQHGSYEALNFGAKHISDEGAHPFVNSLHPAGFVVGFCDGSARFIDDTIDGRVWSMLVTPDGGGLPSAFRHGVLREDQIWK